MSIWICLLIGVGIGFLVAGVLKAQLKSVHRANAAEAYLTADSVHLTVKTDRFLYENVVRTPRAKSK